MTFVSPKKPAAFAGGYVVLESDGARIAEYTRWLPLFQRESCVANQYYPFKFAKWCPAVNPSMIEAGVNTINEAVMGYSNLRTLRDYGCEIVSHGKKHSALKTFKLKIAANAGDTVLTDDGALIESPIPGYKYTISEGATSEEFTCTGRDTVTFNVSGKIYISSPLQNSYTTNAVMLIAQESAIEELSGAVSALSAQNIECKHLVLPFYSYDDSLRPLMEAYYTSATGSNGQNTIGTIDVYKIKRVEDLSTMTTARIDQLLTETQAANTVLFMQAHGDSTAAELVLLRHLIQSAASKGMRFLTSSDAVAWIKERQSA